MTDGKNYGAGWDEATRAYFDSLPVFLQESIMQSGVRAETEPDLRALADRLRERPGR